MWRSTQWASLVVFRLLLRSHYRQVFFTHLYSFSFHVPACPSLQRSLLAFDPFGLFATPHGLLALLWTL